MQTSKPCPQRVCAQAMHALAALCAIGAMLPWYCEATLSTSPAPCTNGNNATGSSVCACGPDTSEAGHQRVINLACVGPAGSQGGIITGVVFASLGDVDTASILWLALPSWWLLWWLWLRWQ